jgi:acetate kinase
VRARRGFRLPRLELVDEDGRIERSLPLADPAAAAGACLSLLRARQPERFDGNAVTGLAHRVVHGGFDLPPAARLDEGALAAIRAATPLAPLHQGPALQVIQAMAREFPRHTPAVAVFDTGFFRDLPQRARAYALPRALGGRHRLQRTGFHGIAHQALYEDACRIAGLDPATARVVSLQLGHGCSAAAIAGGHAVDTSMGFTPLAGLVMATRCGDVDPGVLLYLLGQGLGAEELGSLLHRRSGLLGMCGEADMRTVLARAVAGDGDAGEAIGVFCHRVRHYIGAFLATLGGADAIVFGGGIGANAPEIRARCLEGLGWAGVELGIARNRSAPGRISTDSSRIAALALATDEERLIAREAAPLLSEACA